MNWKLLAIMPLFFLCACSTESQKKHFILAEKFWSSGNYLAAVSEYEKVSKKDPKTQLGLQALYRAATTQTLFLNQHQDAIQKLESFIQLSGDSKLIWGAVKEIADIEYSRMSDYPKAIQQYEKLISLQPDATEVPEFLFRIAKSNYFLWNFDAALVRYRKIVSTYPNSETAIPAHFEVAVTLFTKAEQFTEDGKARHAAYQTALDAYQDFINQHPEHKLTVQARFGVASCLEELDQVDRSIEEYQALLKIHPSPRVVQIKLLRLQERRNQKGKAVNKRDRERKNVL